MVKGCPRYPSHFGRMRFGFKRFEQLDMLQEKNDHCISKYIPNVLTKLCIVISNSNVKILKNNLDQLKEDIFWMQQHFSYNCKTVFKPRIHATAERACPLLEVFHRTCGCHTIRVRVHVYTKTHHVKGGQKWRALGLVLNCSQNKSHLQCSVQKFVLQIIAITSDRIKDSRKRPRARTICDS